LYKGGYLKITIVEATFDHSVSGPFIEVNYQNRKYRTKYGRGKSSQWRHSIEFQVTDLGDEIYFKVFDK